MWAKKPLQSTKDADAWLSPSEACEFVSRNSADGVGFVLGYGIVGIDLDDCIGVSETLHEIARDAMELGTYCERTPSGRGLHVLIRGTIEKPRKYAKRDGAPGREIYDGREGSSRYFTVTGNRLGAATEIREGPEAQAALDAFVGKWFPEQTAAVNSDHKVTSSQRKLDDDEALSLMFDASDGAKWRAIVNEGDYSRFYPSQSEADLALAYKLRFYTGADVAQMERLFRRSGLMRPKWDENRGRSTYGELTLEKAIKRGGPLYFRRDSYDDANKRDAWERKAWAKVPAWVFIRLGGAGELACRVYGIIASHADSKHQAWPTVETIARHCRVTERSIRTALGKLKASGVLSWTQRPRESNFTNWQ